MEMRLDLTRQNIMTNKPDGFQREIRVKGQRLEDMKSLKYIGSVISNKGFKAEFLSRIAKTTAALSTLKPIWRDKIISLASKPSRKHLRTKVTPDFLLTYSTNGGNLGSESK